MPFATSIQLEETDRMIRSVLNATKTWDGAVDDPRRFTEAITKSRVYATLEVVKAIAANPQHGYWGELATQEPIDHDELLPEHIGGHGIPMIVPFPGATPRTGVKGDPDEIDSYRNDENNLYSKTAHDEADENGEPSEVSMMWSMVNGQFKFTGYEATIPMIHFYEADCATRTPLEFLPTIVKLAPLWNLKEGDNLTGIAAALVNSGRADLGAIASGAMTVSPISDVMSIQSES